MAQTSVSWRVAWQEALYSTAGFYRRDRAPDLDFSTAMHGVPQAAKVMARALDALANRHGLTTLIDMGAHRGQLAAALDLTGSSLRYVGVDVHPQPPHTARIDKWLESPGGPGLPEDLRGIRGALVVAHEWLDVVPAVVAAAGPSGEWHERWVDVPTGECRPGPPVAARDQRWLEQWAGPGVSIAEVGRSRDDAFSDLLDRVEHGVVLVVDYGHHRHTRPLYGSLRGYREGRQVAPVPDGSMDLTADVAIDALLAAAQPLPGWAVSQREALQDLLGPAQKPDQQMAREDPQTYLDALAELGARRELEAPEAFGGFWWVCVDRTQ